MTVLCKLFIFSYIDSSDNSHAFSSHSTWSYLFFASTVCSLLIQLLCTEYSAEAHNQIHTPTLLHIHFKRFAILAFFARWKFGLLFRPLCAMFVCLYEQMFKMLSLPESKIQTTIKTDKVKVIMTHTKWDKWINSCNNYSNSNDQQYDSIKKKNTYEAAK